MEHLKGVCLKKIIQSLNEGNVCEIARAVVLYNEEELNGAVESVLIRNLRGLQGTEEFDALTKREPNFLNSALMGAVLRSQGALTSKQIQDCVAY